MKILIILFLFQVSFMNCMDFPKTPVDIIITHIKEPQKMLEELKKFTPLELMNSRDENHSNLIYIITQELFKQKNEVIYKQLKNDCKPVFRYLTAAGINVNEFNYNNDTAYFLAYRSDEKFTDSFLFCELCAKSTALAPQIRSFTKDIKKLCCCGSHKRKIN